MPGWLKLMLVLAIGTAAGAGYLYFIDPDLGRKVLRGTPMAPSPAVTTAYKWRDAQGNWQLTDQPPAPGIAYETLEAHHDANIMPTRPAKP